MPIVNNNVGMKFAPRPEDDEDEPQIMARLMAKYGRLPSFPFVSFSADPLKKDDVFPEPLVSLPSVAIPERRILSPSVHEGNQRHLPSASQRGFVVPIDSLVFQEDMAPNTPKLMPVSEPESAFFCEAKYRGRPRDSPMAPILVPASGKFQGRNKAFNKPVLNVCADLPASHGDGVAPPVKHLQQNCSDLPLSPRTPNHPIRERKPLQSGLTKLLRQSSQKKEEEIVAPS